MLCTDYCLASPNAQVFDLVSAGTVRPYLTESVLAEYHDVFEYKPLKHLDKRRIARLRGLLEALGVKVKPHGRLKISGHESDNRIYECAFAAKAHFIVTDAKRRGLNKLTMRRGGPCWIRTNDQRIMSPLH